MKFGPLALNEAEGAILAHSIRQEHISLPKGKKLTLGDVETLRAAGIQSIIAASLEDGDLQEDEAAEALANAIGLDGVSRSPATTGRVNFHALANGLFRVEKEVVDRMNAVDPALTLATLADRAPVKKGDMVATVKVIPLAAGRTAVDAACTELRAREAFSVAPYVARNVALIATVLPQLKASVMDKTHRLLNERLAPSGSRVAREERCAHSADVVSEHIRLMVDQHDLIVVFGASAMTDPADVIPEAIRMAGGRVEIAGIPVDPGNLLVLGWVGDVPVIGAPGCARSPKENGFDWILNRVLAGEKPTRAEAMGLGVGGLLKEIPLRPRPRENSAQKSEDITVGIALLAAGKASRMGGKYHKLLAEFDSQPLVRKCAEAAIGSNADAVVAVTGHRAAEVEAALVGLPLEMKRNEAFETGMASSIKTGLASLSGMDGLMILLGDMPGVTTADINEMVEAFRISHGTSIIRAVSGGKRGNPVILPRSVYSALNRLQGDIGARHIIEKGEVPVIDVEIGDAAHLDVDTPDAIIAAGGKLKG